MHKIAENVYLEVGSADPIESENLVEFHLLYSGPLHTGSAESVRKEKHAIRSVFHPQLQRLWHTNPNLMRLARAKGSEYAARQSASDPDYVERWNKMSLPDRESHFVQLAYKALGVNWNRGGFNFAPLVTEEFCLRCSLEILFLRAEEKNYIIQGGDIDGRLKSLFDALRMADTGELPPKASPSADEDPFFVLLQDDRLISEVRVNTGQLLRLPESRALNQHDVYLQITVRLNSAKMTNYSWAF